MDRYRVSIVAGFLDHGIGFLMYASLNAVQIK